MRAPDLLKREFTATAPNQLWVADFTHCSTWSGVVYVAFIVDVPVNSFIHPAGRPINTSMIEMLDHWLDSVNTRQFVTRTG